MSVYEVHVVGNHTTTTLYSTHSVSVWYCVYVYSMYVQYIYTACVYSICTAVCVSTSLYYVHVCMSDMCTMCIYNTYIQHVCTVYVLQYNYVSTQLYTVSDIMCTMCNSMYNICIIACVYSICTAVCVSTPLYWLFSPPTVTASVSINVVSAREGTHTVTCTTTGGTVLSGYLNGPGGISITNFSPVGTLNYRGQDSYRASTGTRTGGSDGAIYWCRATNGIPAPDGSSSATLRGIV